MNLFISKIKLEFYTGRKDEILNNRNEILIMKGFLAAFTDILQIFFMGLIRAGIIDY